MRRLSYLGIGTLFIALAVAVAPGCGDDDDNGGGGSGGSGGTGGSGGSPDAGRDTAPAVTFAEVSQILTSNCAFCHSGGGGSLPSSMMITNRNELLMDSMQCASMGGRKRVKPGDAANSYI